MSGAPDELQEGTRTGTLGNILDLPTFYEIKADNLPPLGKNTRKIFMLGKL